MNKDQSDRKKEYAFEGNHCHEQLLEYFFDKHIHVIEVCINHLLLYH